MSREIERLRLKVKNQAAQITNITKSRKGLSFRPGKIVEENRQLKAEIKRLTNALRRYEKPDSSAQSEKPRGGNVLDEKSPETQSGQSSENNGPVSGPINDELDEISTPTRSTIEELVKQRDQCLEGVTKQSLIDKITADFDGRIATVKRRI